MEAALNGPTGRIIIGPADMTIGRLSGNQLVVNDPKASSHHAEIRSTGQGYNLTDLGSTNGTFVNEQRLATGVPYALNPGDRVRIGDTTYTYEISGAAPIAPTVYGSPAQANTPGYDPTVAAANPYGDNSPGYNPTVAAGSPYGIYDAGAPAAYPPPAPQAYQAANYQAPPAYPPLYGDPAQPAYVPPAPGVPVPGIPPARQSRRTLWIILGIVGGVLVVGIIACVALVAAFASTPTKTLQSYCDAFKSGDYQSAYNQLSSSLQSQVTESQFANVEDTSIRPLGGVSSCNVSNVNQSGSSATGTITYTFGDGKSGPVPYTLVDENNTWKISREGSG